MHFRCIAGSLVPQKPIVAQPEPEAPAGDITVYLVYKNHFPIVPTPSIRSSPSSSTPSVKRDLPYKLRSYMAVFLFDHTKSSPTTSLRHLCRGIRTFIQTAFNTESWLPAIRLVFLTFKPWSYKPDNSVPAYSSYFSNASSMLIGLYWVSESYSDTPQQWELTLPVRCCQVDTWNEREKQCIVCQMSCVRPRLLTK